MAAILRHRLAAACLVFLASWASAQTGEQSDGEVAPVSETANVPAATTATEAVEELIVEAAPATASTPPAQQASRDSAVDDQGSAAIPFRQEDFNLGDSITSSMLYLGLLFAIAAVAVLFFKRRLVSSGALPETLGEHIRLLDRRTLSTRTTVHLLDVDGRAVLVTESSSSAAANVLELEPENAPGFEGTP